MAHRGEVAAGGWLLVVDVPQRARLVVVVALALPLRAALLASVRRVTLYMEQFLSEVGRKTF